MAEDRTFQDGKPIAQKPMDYADCVKQGGSVGKDAEGYQCCVFGDKKYRKDAIAKGPQQPVVLVTSEKVKALAAQDVKSIHFETDGSICGTVVKVNGKVIENLAGASFTWYPDPYGGLYVRFTTCDKPDTVKEGQLSESHTFHLNPVCSTSATAKLTAERGAPADMLNPAAVTAAFKRM